MSAKRYQIQAHYRIGSKRAMRVIARGLPLDQARQLQDKRQQRAKTLAVSKRGFFSSWSGWIYCLKMEHSKNEEKEMAYTMILEPGNRITFKAITRHSSSKASRLVTGFYNHQPTVRYEGSGGFVVRWSEILEVETISRIRIQESKPDPKLPAGCDKYLMVDCYNPGKAHHIAITQHGEVYYNQATQGSGEHGAWHNFYEWTRVTHGEWHGYRDYIDTLRALHLALKAQREQGAA